MKQCPVCKTTYADASMSFCLNDGAILTASFSNLEATRQLSFASNPTLEINSPTRVNAQSNTSQISQPTNTSRASPKLVGLVLISVICVISAIAGTYFVFVRKDDSASVISTPTPMVTTVPVQNTAPDETKALKAELEKLKKQVNKQKNKKPDSIVSNPAQSSPNTMTAHVNSPGDGFLYLRTEPSVKTGIPLVKIPTGATVQVENCQGNKTTTDTKRGRWCMISYDGQAGWAFDAWLVY